MIQNSQNNPLRTVHLDDDFAICAERLKALAEPIRLKIVTLLAGGPKTVGEIATGLDEDIVKVSHHLGILRTANILTSAKEGRFVRYGLEPEVVRMGKKYLSGQIDFGCCRIQLEKVDDTVA